LVQARKHAKLTQEVAAKRAGMAQSTLGELEMEGQGSTFTAQLAEIYSVNPNWLATGRGEMLGKDVEAAPPRVATVLPIPAPENQELNDAIRLLELFSQASANGKSFILTAAINAEKASGRKRSTSTRD